MIVEVASVLAVAITTLVIIGLLEKLYKKLRGE